MSITITVERSDEWVGAKRLATGENVPQRLEVGVEPSALSASARAILLQAGGGGYRDCERLLFDRNYAICRHYYGHGSEPILSDSDDPTVEELSDALVAAAERIATKGITRAAEDEARECARAAEEQAKAEAKAATEQARELLAEELTTLREYGERLYGYREMLGSLLAHVPVDALRGAVRRMAEVELESTVTELTAAVEEAYPFRGTLFREDEDEE